MIRFSGNAFGALMGISLLALTLTSCAGPTPPADQYFRLDVTAPTAMPAPALPGVVEVNRFAAQGLAGERSMLYSRAETPGQVARYSYALWVESPTLLLQNQLIAVMRGARAADLVVSPDLHTPPEHVVQGRILRFEEVLGPTPKVVVELELGVVRLHGGEMRLLRTYRAEAPLNGDKPADAAQGFQTAVGDIFGHFVTDLQTLRP